MSALPPKRLAENLGNASSVTHQHASYGGVSHKVAGRHAVASGGRGQLRASASEIAVRPYKQGVGFRIEHCSKRKIDFGGSARLEVEQLNTKAGSRVFESFYCGICGLRIGRINQHG